jgi:hypothetical protein
MADWAELDDTDTVLRVIVTEDGQAGYDWIMGSLGGRWVESFADGSQRARPAGPEMVYDSQRDVFYFPKPDDGNPLWFFNEDTVQWELPKPVVEEIVLDPNWTPPIEGTP